MYTKVFFLIFICTVSLIADGYRIEVKKILDSNAQDTLLPNLILPISWNENLSSSIEYRSGESTDERKSELNNIDDSLINEVIKHSRLKLNAINYHILDDNFSYSFGVGGSYESYEKTQNGYYISSASRSDFDSSVDINLLSLYVKVQGIYKTTYFDTKLYALVIPMSKLDVTQQTLFSGAINKNLKASSSKEQKVNYEVDLELTTKTSTYLDFNFNAKYRFLPLDYTLDTGSGSKDTSKEEDILLLSARLLLNIELLNGWMPTIGYSKETTDSKDLSDGSLRKLEENIVYIGLNTRF